MRERYGQSVWEASPQVLCQTGSLVLPTLVAATPAHKHTLSSFCPVSHPNPWLRHPATHPITQSAHSLTTKSPNHSPNHSLIHSLTRPVRHSVTRSITRSDNHSLRQSLAQSPTRSITRSITQSLAQSLAQSLNHSLNHSLSHSPRALLVLVTSSLVPIYHYRRSAGGTGRAIYQPDLPASDSHRPTDPNTTCNTHTETAV